jgi:hypothetical protein
MVTISIKWIKLLIGGASSLILVGLMLWYLAVLLINFNKIGKYRLFILLPLFGLTQIITTNFLPAIVNEQNSDTFYDTILSIYILTEYSVFTYILYALSTKNISTGILSFTAFLVILFYCISIINYHNFLIENHTIFTIISTLLVITQSLILIIKYVFDDNIINLNNSHEFFLALALFAFYTYIFPNNLFDNFIRINPTDYTYISISTNNIGYLFFYLLLIKSVKCKIRQIK